VAGPAKTAFKRAQYALCDQVVCVSEASIHFVEMRYGVGRHKAVAIPNGIGLKALPAAWPQGPPLFVAIGAVIAQKGYEVLLDAAARARVPWRAEVIGEGPHRVALAARADRSEVPVHFSGHSSEVGSAIDAATALVVPSRWEAWPYVAMEAMERGRPVVASRVDGLSEIVADGTSGLLVSPGDANALAAALDRLAGDPAFAAMLGRAGRERVLSFRLDGMVEALLGVYEKALGAQHHRLPVGSGR
jgi:glycosyltransferase involved in cell wall biosynthesis